MTKTFILAAALAAIGLSAATPAAAYKACNADSSCSVSNGVSLSGAALAATPKVSAVRFGFKTCSSDSSCSQSNGVSLSGTALAETPKISAVRLGFKVCNADSSCSVSNGVSLSGAALAMTPKITAVRPSALAISADTRAFVAGMILGFKACTMDGSCAQSNGVSLSGAAKPSAVIGVRLAQAQ